MTHELLVAGGGIGGLAAACAARRAGWEARLFEQAQGFSEVGAGIQLGPNATRILREWGLWGGALQQQLWLPQRLAVRDAMDGRELAAMALGADFESRYGAPYATMHRADLQAALLAACAGAGVRLHTGRRVAGVQDLPDGVAVDAGPGAAVEGDALVGADGLWSAVRAFVAGGGAPQPTGHLAFRGLVRQQDLPRGLRSAEVTAWLGPRMHLVTYPVRAGESLNAVCVVHGAARGDPRDWDHAATRAELESALGPAGRDVRERIAAIPHWRRWVLHDRPPVADPGALARGRVALLGDSAHPMRPYLAQGAGMAIEDARELQRVLCVADGRVLDVATLLRRYALNRWQRAAQVQRRSRRNGAIFHASGPVRVARNIALARLGARLLDQPWLYRG